jgi:twitching motility protein PilT
VARLDPFLAVLREQGADSLRLAAGQPIALKKDGTLRPITRESLTAPQILGLLREISPPELAERLAGNVEVAFTYDGPEGAVEVRVAPVDGALSATLRAVLPRRPAPMVAEPDLRGPAERMAVLCRLLVERGASDLHLRSGSPPLLRTEGHLEALPGAPLAGDEIELLLRTLMTPADFATWKQRGDIDFAHEIPGLSRFRCNAARDRHGPLAVLRTIPPTIRTADEIGLSPEVQALCQLTKGLVLVTGTTGSGKSTTLAALIDLVNRTRPDHIITIEDPIEFVHANRKALVTQRQVGVHTRSFKTALRAALREDPDVILVGEMRDLETISIALETAETGHLVFGSVHTTTAASTVDRIIDQFPVDRQSQIRVMLADSLRAVIAQTLCRRIGGGRIAAFEVLLSTPAVANLIREGKTFQIPSVMQTGRRLGMFTLNDSLLDLVTRGVVEPREAYLRATDRAGLAAMFKGKSIDTSFLAEG